MTALNFLFTRALEGRWARVTRSSSPRSTTTRTSHRGSSSRTTSASLFALQVSPTTSSWTTPTSRRSSPNARASWRSRRRELGRNGTGREAGRRARALGRSARVGRRRPLRAAWPDRRRGMGRRRPHLLAVQVLRPAHGARLRQAGTARVVASLQGGPAADEPVGHRFELGTSQHELLAGFVAASITWARSDGTRCQSHERTLGQRFLDGLPDAVELYGLNGMDRRVPTFCFNVPGRTPRTLRPSSRNARWQSGMATTTPSRR